MTHSHVLGGLWNEAPRETSVEMKLIQPEHCNCNKVLKDTGERDSWEWLDMNSFVFLESKTILH